MQSLTHYYGHLVIVHLTLKLLCFKAIVRHCIVLFCGTIIKSLHLVKFVSRLTMLKEKYLVFLSGVVLVQCMQLIIFVTLRQCYVRTYQGWGQVQLTKYSSTPSTPNIYQVQVLVKYSFFLKVLKYIKYFHIK